MSLDCLPKTIARRWPPADTAKLLSQTAGRASFPIGHTVPAVTTRGGSKAANQTWKTFLRKRLAIYASDRSQPEKAATSGLSPYLHFGHISVHQIFDELTLLAGWTPDKVAGKPTGSASGWWGTSEEVESFLDE